MAFEFKKKLPSPKDIKEQYPMPEELAELKAKRDQEIKDVITGKSNKFLELHISKPPCFVILKKLFIFLDTSL